MSGRTMNNNEQLAIMQNLLLVLNDNTIYSPEDLTVDTSFDRDLLADIEHGYALSPVQRSNRTIIELGFHQDIFERLIPYTLNLEEAINRDVLNEAYVFVLKSEKERKLNCYYHSLLLNFNSYDYTINLEVSLCPPDMALQKALQVGIIDGEDRDHSQNSIQEEKISKRFSKIIF